ncbi:MAG: hypothetical protein LBQ36_08385 [Synergistaceae bacterium]|jgi:methionyl-tRNA formyltransferase|nr:hypothetical protein [Synergistaceae bacterium]
MRVLLIGQKAFGADVLSALAKGPAEIVGALVGTSDTERQDQVETVASEFGVRCFKTASLRKPEVTSWVKERRPDLIVMAFVTLYMPMSLAEASPLGAINFHPSLLPLHRGVSALPWTILCGDKIAGLSVYFVDEGIDTGDVIVQKQADIDESDDFKTLYFKKIYPLGVEAVCEAVSLVASGNPPRVKQDDSMSSYEPPLAREHLVIDWDDAVELNSRKIRAGNPGIGGVTRLDDGREVRVYGCRKCAEVPSGAKPGEIISIGGDGMLVKGLDGGLLLANLGLPGEPKLDGAKFAQTHGLSGARSFIKV